MSHLNPIRPHCHQRQFDVETGIELSPAYRTAQGPAPISAARTPPGVTPQRAGNFLLLLEQNQGQQFYPTRPGTAMSYLFEKMAPDASRVLRGQLYGRKDVAVPSPKMSPDPAGPAKFSWRDVDNAIRGCRFDPETVSLVQVPPAPRGRTKQKQADPTEHTQKEKTGQTGQTENTETTGNTENTSQALLRTFRSQWRTIEACYAADKRLALANERAQAALTSQARQLAVVEHQAALLRQTKAALERAEAEAHYEKMQRVEEQRTREENKKKRMVKVINDELHSLAMSKAEMEARVARGRELQVVLGRRLRDGEARLARLCREHGSADASTLSRVLSEKLAALEAKRNDHTKA